MLSQEQRQRVTEAAEAAGVPVGLALAEAERIVQGKPGDEQVASGQAALVAERFLIGFLPYVTVAELRSKVLGLEGSIADDHLFTGEWLDIHGPKTNSSPTPSTDGEGEQ